MVYLQGETLGGAKSSISNVLTVCGSEKLVRTSSNPTISVFEETMLSGLWNSYPLESMWSVIKEDGMPSICGIESFNLFTDQDCT